MNKSKSFQPDEINKIQETNTIQQYLYNLNRENYLSTISFLHESQYVTESKYHETFIRNLFWAFQLRPKSIEPLFELFIWFSNQGHENKSSITQVLLTFFIRCHSNIEGNSKFIFNFFGHMFKIIDETYEPESVDIKNISEIIEKLLTSNEIQTKIKEELSFQNDDILCIIYQDDIERFTEISAQTYFNINSTITISSPYLFKVTKEMTLIELATVFGSAKIFKYILINGGELNNKQPFSQFAIDGGNSEIIRIIEQKGFQFGENEIAEASYFHQFDILQWILDSHDILNIKKAIEKSASSNFIDGILFFESDKYSSIFYNSTNLIELAAYSGSFDILNFLLNNDNFKLNNTIFSVVEFGNLSSALLLKEKFHSCINKSNRFHLKPILIASQKGDVFMSRFLIENFPELDINAQDRYGATSLHLAIRYNHEDEFKLLISVKNIDVNLCDFGEASPLHEAVCSSNLNFTKTLVENENTNVNIIDQNGLSPLMLALDSLSFDHIKLILNSNKNIDNLVDVVNESISKKCPEITEFFINSNKLDINNKVIVAKIFKNIINFKKFDYLNFLINQKRFNINLCFGEESKSILHYCCSIKELYFYIPIILKRNDVDINIRDTSGLSPLHEAMRSQNNDFSIYLIKDPRIDINARDNGNQTPLHYAVSNWSSVPLTDLLLHPKIDVNLIDKDGKTALFVACELGVVDSVEILLNDYRVDTEIEIESISYFL